MSAAKRFRVAIIASREYVIDVDASSPDVAEEIAEYMYRFLGWRYFSSSDEMLCEASAKEIGETQS